MLSFSITVLLRIDRIYCVYHKAKAQHTKNVTTLDKVKQKKTLYSYIAINNAYSYIVQQHRLLMIYSSHFSSTKVSENIYF